MGYTALCNIYEKFPFSKEEYKELSGLAKKLIKSGEISGDKERLSRLSEFLDYYTNSGIEYLNAQFPLLGCGLASLACLPNLPLFLGALGVAYASCLVTKKLGEKRMNKYKALKDKIDKYLTDF